MWITPGGRTHSLTCFFCFFFSPAIFVWKEERGAASLIGGRRPRSESRGSRVSTLNLSVTIKARLADQELHHRTRENTSNIFVSQHPPPPLLYLFGTWYLVILPHFHTSPLIGKSRSLISASSLSGPSPAWDSIWTSLLMLACHCRAQSARPVGGGGVVTNEVALLISVLMGHYSGLYPPPFRLGSHTGSRCALGITLNKQSNTILLGCVTVFASLM